MSGNRRANQEKRKSAPAPGRQASNLIAAVSHELRLPIANLKLLVETLLAGACDDPDTARRMLTRANEEVERLQHLVVNLLSFEQVSNAKHEWQRRSVPLDERAAYCLEVLKDKAHAKSVELKLEIAPHFLVFANPQQLDQVLLNLVENAIKFTPPGGRVTVKSGNAPGLFSVADTGIGMPAGEIPRIFERFYRIDRAYSRGSTGLGLSIVKHIVDLHGAKITVRSEPGRGSEFFLEFQPEFTI